MMVLELRGGDELVGEVEGGCERGEGGGGDEMGDVGGRTISSTATLFFSVIGDATSRKAGAAATSMSSFGSMIALGDPLQVEQIGPFRTLMARYGGADRKSTRLNSSH